MASAQAWLEVLSWTKTLFEATKASVDLVATYMRDLANTQIRLLLHFM